MTRDEILGMEAGPELNAMVAEKIMGIIAHDSFGCPVAAEYSTDIKAAWKVVEKMSMPFILTKCYREDAHYGELPGWLVSWCKDGECPCKHIEPQYCKHNKIVWAKTAPLAICRAALMAVMGVK